MPKLVLIRHGESEWNKLNLFCGWVDVDLSPEGVNEARFAGSALLAESLKFTHAFTSVLSRATRTCELILETLGLQLTSTSTWRLNERHYGALQGLNKAEVAAKHGEAQVKLWRRSVDIPPPPVDKNSPYWPGNDEKYREIPEDEIPNGESLNMTIKRVLPAWEGLISQALKEGGTVLVVAHGNSLRGLIKTIDEMSDEEILEFNLPTATPLLYELDEDLKPISKRFLVDEETLKAKMEAVASQGKKSN